MKFIERLTLTVLAVFGVFALHQVVAKYLGIHHWDGMKSADWAAWVQAVGSIAALVVAIYVMSQQNKNAVHMVVNADRRALQRRAAAVSVVVDRSNLVLVACANSLEAALKQADFTVHALFDFKTSRPAIAKALDRLEAIPIHELGSAEMAGAIDDLVKCLAYFAMVMDIWSEPNCASPITVKAAADLIEGTRGLASTARDSFHAGVAKLDAAEF